MGEPSGPAVLVSGCKGEARTLRSGYKQLARHLKAARCEVRRLEGAAGVTPAALAGAAILVLGGPTQPFSASELDALRAYLRDGGNLLVLGGECGSGGSGGGAGAAAGAAGAAGAAPGPGSNLNFLLEEYGLSLASDCVIQTAFSRRVV
jgi:intraflagellar transport protein 52